MEVLQVIKEGIDWGLVSMVAGMVSLVCSFVLNRMTASLMKEGEDLANLMLETSREISNRVFDPQPESEKP